MKGTEFVPEPDKFNHRTATAMLCFYYIDVLLTEGVLEGGPFRITEKGIDAAKILVDDGFKLDKKEVMMFLMTIQNEFEEISIGQLMGLHSLIMKMNTEGVGEFLKIWNEYKES